MVAEDDIEAAIRIGGRVNSFTLLGLAAKVLAGAVPPSPALAAWFASAVERIGEGSGADDAFGLRKKPGPDPLADGLAKELRAFAIHDAVEACRARRASLTGNSAEAGAFVEVGRMFNLSEASVRPAYYDIESECITDFGPPPNPKNIDLDQLNAQFAQILNLLKPPEKPSEE